MSTWSEVEPILRERAYRTIDNNPEILFDHDGGPLDLDVDLIHARLIGFDEQIDREMWLSKILPIVFLPIVRPLRFGDFDADDLSASLRTARYELQSGYATLSVAAEYMPPVEKLRPDYTARIAYLRYRRRQ